MDKIREEFEKFCSKRNQYGEAHKQELWEAWIASRESIIVKIPKEGEASSFGKYVVYDYELVVKMLEEAGVHYEYDF